jgi:microcystin-dependent protein
MPEVYVGQLILVAFNFAPEGWFPCDGRTLNIAQYQALFSLLGTTYGGNGQTTFGLPDLRGRVPISFGQGQGLSAYTLGAAGGVEGVTLSVNQMPTHNHLVNATSDPSDNPVPKNAFLGGQGAYQTMDANVTMNQAMLQNTGGNQPHENRQPYLALQWIIAYQGLYPTRP